VTLLILDCLLYYVHFALMQNEPKNQNPLKEITAYRSLFS